MSPDLRQNVITTLYLLFSHNYIVFAYFTGVLISAALSVLKPSRFTVLMMLGFIILVFSYEYDKHIIAGFREQTINSLITATPHYKVQKIVDLAITELLPILFYLLGWGFIFMGIIYGALKLSKKSKL